METKKNESTIIYMVTAAKSNWQTKDGKLLDVFIDSDDNLYLGLNNNYDNHGRYNNFDKSLIKIDNNKDMFHLFCGEGFIVSKKELVEIESNENKKGRINRYSFIKYEKLLNGVLKQLVCIKEQKFAGITYSKDLTLNLKDKIDQSSFLKQYYDEQLPHEANINLNEKIKEER